MNLDLRNRYETNKNNGIEKRINKIMSEIENEFKFKGNTLEKLFSFKLDIERREVTKNSSEYRNALITEIEKRANSGDIISSNNKEKLNQSEYELLANKIIEICKLTDEIKAGIQELRAELLNDNFIEISLTSNSLLTKGIYSKGILKRIDDPKNFTDQLLGLGVGIIESLAILGKFGYDLGKGIAMGPYHLIQIIRGKAKYDGIEI